MLRSLAAKMGRVLRVPEKPQWDEDLGCKDSFTYWIEDHVIPRQPASWLLILDEVDRVFEFDYRDDFFGMLRSWHGLRWNQRWRTIHLVLAHSTNPALWIQDIRQSPFNIAERVTMEDFTADQILKLAAAYNVTVDIRELLDLVGGQPYLVRLALYLMAAGEWKPAEATSASGPFSDHLRQFNWYIQTQDKLRDGLKQVLQDGYCKDALVFERLRSSGLVAGDTNNAVRLRYGLYERYFREQFGLAKPRR